MTELRQGAGRHVEQEWSGNAKRIPRMVSYQTKAQLPLTLLALIVILTVVLAVWILTL